MSLYVISSVSKALSILNSSFIVQHISRDIREKISSFCCLLSKLSIHTITYHNSMIAASKGTLLIAQHNTRFNIISTDKLSITLNSLKKSTVLFVGLNFNSFILFYSFFIISSSIIIQTYNYIKPFIIYIIRKYYLVNLTVVLNGKKICLNLQYKCNK